MSVFQAAIYGIIQGLTEFLPVSSSAHLTLLPFFTGWPDPGLAFDVALHWGTLLAVLIYFRKDVLHLAINSVGILQGKKDPDHQLPWKIVVATFPGVIAGFLCEKQAETMFRSPVLLIVTLSVMGLLLWIADHRGSKMVPLSEISWRQAIIIGLAQAIAIIPGVSRSGVTITAGLFLGLDREAAVKYSFFLAIPITLGAGSLKIKYLVHNLNDIAIITGIFASLVCGLAAIHILITYVRTKSFTPFVIYRFALAAATALMLSFTAI